MKSVSVLAASILLLLCSSSFERPNVPVHHPIIVTADSLHVRSGPGRSFSITNKLTKNTKLSVSDLQGDWYYVESSDIQGWVFKKFTKTVALRSVQPSMQVAQRQPVYTLSKSFRHLKGKTIIIDAGHGGKDKGAIGTQGTYEKDLTLRTALILQNKLQKEGAHVILTRTHDEYLLLSQRTLQSTKADAFISIHYNSTNSSQLTGLMTYYYHQHQDSPLTHSIHQSLINHAKLKDKGERFGNYYVLRENTRPSTLIELGFLSNEREETYINSISYQQMITSAIAEGLNHYFQEKEKTQAHL
ncbi:N-acetylmuramoyl-L-alanine amidase [Priestia sp. 40]|uniref:N-acetylmuramoyl-L-alanine amidase n=1 Tax=Priestia sp. 40 TaxID=3394459 RepID=UPI0015FD001A